MSIPHKEVNAPFGPLQELAVECIETFFTQSKGKGSVVIFAFIMKSSKNSKLDQPAPAVDFVKSYTLARLISRKSPDKTN